MTKLIPFSSVWGLGPQMKGLYRVFEVEELKRCKSNCSD